MTRRLGAGSGSDDPRSGSSGSARWAATTCASSATIPGVRLAAIADPLPDGPRGGREPPRAPAMYAEPLPMLAEERTLDAVVIASPTTTHLRAGPGRDRARASPVLVEKPLAATPEDATRIVDAAEARGVPVQVGHIERFNPAVLELGRLLDAGWLSTVYAITSRRGGPFPDRIRDVGVTMDLATHDVDILSLDRRRAADPGHAETAQRDPPDHEDLLFGLMRFPSGTVAMLDVDWLTPTKRRQPDRPRRGGHVRARLPDPATDVHACDRR